MATAIKNCKKTTQVKKIANKANVKKASENSVVGRECEFKLVKQYLDSFIRSGISSSLYITGVPGSGKTYVVKKVLLELGVPFSFVNCAKLKKRTDIYKKICEELKCYEEKRDLQGLRAHFSSCSEFHIIILDEIDFIYTKNEVSLYNLFELPLVEEGKVFLITISNTLGRLSIKLESRIGKERLNFKPYTSMQLIKVAKSISKTNNIGRIDEKSLELISRRVGSATGDIRKVVDILEMSGGMDINGVHNLMIEMQTPLLKKFICNMTYSQKLLLYLNKDGKKNVPEWFDSLKGYCKRHKCGTIDFIEFKDIIEDLEDFGIFKINGINVTSCFLEEDIEIIGKGDAIFSKFKL